MTRIPRSDETGTDLSENQTYRINKCEVIRNAIHDLASRRTFLDSSFISWHLEHLYSDQNDYNNLSRAYIQNLNQLS